MAHRTFTDLTGRTWQVWSTRPGPRSKVAPELREGWLTFEAAGGEKKRVAPVPPGWENTSELELRRMLESGTPVAPSRRTTALVLEEASAPPR